MPNARRAIAVVTGASSGIGKALARYLLSQDYKVVLISQNKERLESAYTELLQVADHARVHAVSLDVGDYGHVTNAMEQIVAENKRIDILINSAGYVKRGTSDLLHTEFAKMLHVNLEGVFNMVSAAVPTMKEQRSGRIINISSYSGIVVRSTLGGYAASKSGLMGYNEALHKELATYGIYVTAICPNLVDTEMTKDVTSVSKADLMQVDDIVHTLDYLLKLSPAVMVKEIALQCRAKLLMECDI
ncbi:SDR family oxidoreductase [Facilibium subflavum]|uniref:SDR family oxidoreductase n=2 Tax=Fastidiosibacteraceae TaxID=2056687 RepID=UPI000E656C06|nr:SDR family oxidoreductase [Facilibium subflavum]